MNRPNIVYIHSHDTGRYIQPYGHAIPTPNLQRLAEQGVLFRKCFCAAPTCSASRAAMLTGQASHSAGMTGLVNRGWDLKDHSQHLVNALKGAGYYTALCGIQHVARDKKDIGYDEIIPAAGNLATWVSAAASHWLYNDVPDQPFFLSVGTFETHRAFRAAQPDDDPRYCMPPAPLPDTPRHRQDMAEYKTMARAYDLGVGEVLAALEANGLAENTLVICTTDHGIAFPGMKCNLTDHGIGVLLIMRGPAGFAGGKVVDGMVSHIDLFPTLCEMLEIDKPDWLQGKSFLPLVDGSAEEINDEIFAEVSYHAAYEPQRCVRTQRWKYVRRFLDRDVPVMANCDNSLSKQVWMEAGWGERKVEHEQLYDLLFDPNEVRNLAGDPAHADVLQEMRGRLDAWMKRTDDPLLQGDVPAPDGAVVNPPDSMQPSER